MGCMYVYKKCRNFYLNITLYKIILFPSMLYKMFIFWRFILAKMFQGLLLYEGNAPCINESKIFIVL